MVDAGNAFRLTIIRLSHASSYETYDPPYEQKEGVLHDGGGQAV